MNDDKLQLTIARLSADYAAALPGTVARMEALWRRIVAAESPLSQLSELSRMAHGISGSGATFGLAGASRAARELETIVNRLQQGGTVPDQTEQLRVAALFSALRQAAA